ncbi:Aste57867_2943 [Aphanomyces stellatus]|uniref:Aste57867_2943 protein n=1 Tax=Aphanomyces stellatus TaxID=120398 RepID=A0A485K9Q1_9STRA|nr:hypothetical protein As57867_002935 [Aphanomyces stellatus]VFT80126.1 Aste57867_2943 [Aphanomyces stellatus]
MQFSVSLAAAAAVALFQGASAQLTTFPLCKGNPVPSYSQAATQYPQIKNAITKLNQFQFATWWTDNNPSYFTEMQKLLNNCNDSSVPTVIVYGLPNKDCKAAFSNLGTNRDADSYSKFISDLADLVGTRPVNYIFEPDALSLSLEEPCAANSGYLDNMMATLPLLTDGNKNASVYVDVGYWSFKTDELTGMVAQAIKQLTSKTAAGASAIRGISLGTSNYRTTSDMVALCKKFNEATTKLMKKGDFKCVVDTSRNYLGPAAGTGEWCNNRYAAIGVPPTSNTSNDLIDYFLWLKTPGESDGQCNTPEITSDALKNGPAAGQFFEKAFSLMWDRGYFVDKKLGEKLNEFSIDVDQIKQGGNTSWVAIGIIAACCIILIVAGVLIKRRNDAKQGRARNARTIDAEAAVRKPYLSL